MADFLKKNLLLFFCSFPFLLFAQQNEIDSLQNAVLIVVADTEKVNTLNHLADILWRIGMNDKAMEYSNQALAISQRATPSEGLSKGIGNAYNTIGIIHHNQGNYALALENYFMAIKIFEEIGFKRALAWSYNNIGLVNCEQSNLEKAIQYHSMSLKIFEEINEKQGIATCFNNMGNIHYLKSDYDNALELYLKSIKIKEEINFPSGLVMPYNNIGTIWYYKGDTLKALEYYFKALKAGEQTENKNGMAMALNYIGDLYIDLKEFKDATEYLLKGLNIAKEIGSKERIGNTYRSLSNLSKTQSLWKSAFEYHKLYLQYKDSVFNEETSNQMAEMQTKYETEKKELQIENLNKDNAIKETEIKKQNLQKLAFASGFGLMFLLAFVIFRGYKQKQKANVIITTKKQEVEKAKELVDGKNKSLELAYKHIEEKNHEILDSIRYAKRIQEAILSPQKLVKQYLENSFILYKPKDIVAGDFYWMYPISSREVVFNTKVGIPVPGQLPTCKSGDREALLFAVCDCTGHGVPGAFVSILGHNSLNRCVKEFGLIQPAEILDKLCELIDEAFSKSEADIKDGMDIALCALEFPSPLESNGRVRLQYSGAGNSLYLVSENKLIEFKADKQPVGKYSNRKPFTNHFVELQKNDAFYIFTDGYADQFGGPKGKKFKYRQFEKLLISIQDKPMTEQREILNATVDNWKGELEQVDDICIVGVRI